MDSGLNGSQTSLVLQRLGHGCDGRQEIWLASSLADVELMTRATDHDKDSIHASVQYLGNHQFHDLEAKNESRV